jgi:hypothetical protein
VGKIDLVRAIDQVREELVRAVRAAGDREVQFPVGQVSLSFQVGFTESGTASGGLKLWVVELGAAGNYARESIQTVTITLEPPVTKDGRPVKVMSSVDQLPD